MEPDATDSRAHLRPGATTPYEECSWDQKQGYHIKSLLATRSYDTIAGCRLDPEATTPYQDPIWDPKQQHHSKSPLGIRSNDAVSGASNDTIT